MKLWLINCLLFIASPKVPDAVIAHAPLTAVIKRDVAYGNDPRQKMDLYLPANRNIDITKVVILVHGGSWIRGDKADLTPFIAGLQQKLPGYAFFNINYRLAGKGTNLFPSQENDMKAAVSFIYSKRNEYGISDKFVYLGASAGGYLALLQAYKYDMPVKPKAVVSFFGPTDLSALYNSNPVAGMLLAQVTGNTPATNSALYRQVSPSTFITSQAPPTILLQGGADPFVPPAQAELLTGLLNSAGVVNKYVFYPSQAHGWTGETLNDSFTQIASFLELNVQ